MEELIKIAKILRSKNGCPWDREQTLESLKPFLVEEAYEASEAIEKGEAEKIKEELGDLLFQIVMMSQIAKEENLFTIEDVIKGAKEKMIRRHPHVFSNEKVKDAKDVKKKWESIKRKEGKNPFSVSFSSQLFFAEKLGRVANRFGFDWSDEKEILEKIEEEKRELEEAISKGDREKIKEEIGDLLFSVVNIARFLNISSELCLKEANEKFAKRFSLLLERLEAKGMDPLKTDISYMDEIWERIKSEGGVDGGKSSDI